MEDRRKENRTTQAGVWLPPARSSIFGRTWIPIVPAGVHSSGVRPPWEPRYGIGRLALYKGPTRNVIGVISMLMHLLASLNSC